MSLLLLFAGGGVSPPSGGTVGSIGIGLELGLDGSTWQTTGPSWTDLLEDVLSVSDGIHVKRGRSIERDEFQAGTLTATLRDTIRKYDPKHTTGPYYGFLKPAVPMRLRAQPTGQAVFDIWRGTNKGWPQRYPGAADRVTFVPLEGYDFFDKLARARIGSAYQAEVEQDDPYVWFRLTETEGHIAYDSSGNGRDGAYSYEPVSVDGIVPYGSDSAVQFSGDQRVIVDHDYTTDRFDIEFWVQTSESNAGVIVDYGSLFGGLYRFTVDISGGNVRVRSSDGVGTQWVGDSTVSDGDPHHVVITDFDLFVANQIRVDGVADSLTTTTPSYAGSEVSRIAIGATLSGTSKFTGVLSEVALYESVLSSARWDAHRSAGRTPWNLDRSDERLARLLDAAGYPASMRALEVGESTFGYAVFNDGERILDACRNVEKSEDGRFFIAPNGDATFHNRYWSFTATEATTSQATFADDGSSIVYTAGDLDLDDELIVNSMALSNRTGANVRVRDATSIDLYGEAGESQTDLLLRTEQELRALGEHKINRQKTPQERLGSLTIVLSRLTPADQATVLGLDIGHMVTVTRQPLNTGSTRNLALVVEGVAHDITARLWTTTLYVSPAYDVDFWIWGTSTWGETTTWAY